MREVAKSVSGLEPEASDEVADILTAICVISKLLATKIRRQSMEGGSHDGEEEGRGEAPCGP